MFDLGAAGAAGLNIEGGVNHLGWISKYSPIDNDERGDYLARPLYYGMLAFSLASRGHFVGVESDVAGTAFKAYAVLGNDGRLWLTLINKDASRQAEVTLVPPPSFASGDVIRLTAPSMDSTSHVTLGGPRSRVTVNGLQKNARA